MRHRRFPSPNPLPWVASLGTVAALMLGLHVLIGIGEGVITAATVGAVAAARPDLVYLLRGTAAPLEVRGSAS